MFSRKKRLTKKAMCIFCTLQILISRSNSIERGSGVTAEIYTHTPNEQLQLDIQRHNSQYMPIPIHVFTHSHDRFLCIDDTVYHIGASLKDLGKKWFAFSRMEINTESLLEKM